ncbi:MAG: alpha-ketoacid dehydrogenase subunit beta [Alphaproteobacteria bacterium]|jgi:pyruvate/2-oxoglutarate/acetoin dehydrogenase E1 component|nr:alpha-ketoacid dehydrogenase subunit beta [Alphaproteobacteria bacterium]MDP6563378.1 alpha-ketoacid dehydrogenase subunit beta [Alphaproteobacteria bacterium]MDP6812140.1 alpha-ketoacid dehydrogenase subunit beta [Alphaproteobacteria bacterium]
MPNLTVLESLNAAMAHELEHDPDVVLMGEDVGQAGGIFRTSQGLQQRFGSARVIDTPLDEKGIVAHAIGMALYGLKPIAEIQFSGFIHDAFEHIMFCAARYRWASGGQYSCPMVIRAPSFGGIKGGLWHSQSVEAYFVHHGGIKILVPSTPQDAYGMTIAAVRDPDPVLLVEPVPLYRALSAEVELDGQPIEIGKASVLRQGDDCTVLTYGPIRHWVAEVADELAAERGYQAEVIDLRSLIPYDIECILSSVRKTGRVVIVHEAPLSLGYGAELAAVIQDKAFGYLHTPIQRLAAPDVPYHFSIGDEYYRPSRDRIRAAIERTMEYEI